MAKITAIWDNNWRYKLAFKLTFNLPLRKQAALIKTDLPIVSRRRATQFVKALQLRDDAVDRWINCLAEGERLNIRHCRYAGVSTDAAVLPRYCGYKICPMCHYRRLYRALQYLENVRRSTTNLAMWTYTIDPDTLLDQTATVSAVRGIVKPAERYLISRFVKTRYFKWFVAYPVGDITDLMLRCALVIFWTGDINPLPTAAGRGEALLSAGRYRQHKDISFDRAVQMLSYRYAWLNMPGNIVQTVEQANSEIRFAGSRVKSRV